MKNKPKKIPISAARQIAKDYGYEQVVIIGRRHSDNAVEHVTTYGVDKANCEVAAKMGDVLKKAMGWQKSPKGLLP